MKAKDLAQILLQHPDSQVGRKNDSGFTVNLKKAEILKWVDKGSIKSHYSDQDVRRHEREKNDIGPLKKLRKPRFNLVF